MHNEVRQIAEGDRHDLIEGEDWFIRGQPPPGDPTGLWFWRDEIEAEE